MSVDIVPDHLDELIRKFLSVTESNRNGLYEVRLWGIAIVFHPQQRTALILNGTRSTTA